MPFPDEETPTRPEGFRAELRLMAERVLAAEPADIAVLRMLHAEAPHSEAGALRYMKAAAQFLDRLLR
jgi:hypothetical protein